MTTLTATIGLPGSGKTTWAAAQRDTQPPGHTIIVSRDDLRLALHGRAHYLPETELQITGAQNAIILNALRHRTNVIVADTNLRHHYVQRLASLAGFAKAEFVTKSFLHVPIAVCIKRDAARPSPVGEEFILAMWQRYLDEYWQREQALAPGAV